MIRRDRISGRQLGGLALTAFGLPIFRLCCRISWPWVLLGGGAAALLLSALTRRFGRPGAAARPLPNAAGARVLWLTLLTVGALLAAWESSFAFPETAGNVLAAALVLGLAAAAARIGSAAACRCAGILLWVTGALYGTVLLFSLPQLRPERLIPAGTPTDALRVFAAMLPPGAALCLRGSLEEDQRLPRWPWLSALCAALAAALVTGGILSPALAGEPEAFRTLSRGVSVLGVIRRFEALVNGALLMSGFCLCALLLSAAAAILRPSGLPEAAKTGRKK